MRRLSLSTKLLAAALPLVVAVGLLLVLTVRSDLNSIERAESGANLGEVWEPLIESFSAVQAEADANVLADTITIAEQMSGEAGAAAVAADPVLRRTTDQAMNDLRTAVEKLGAFEAASGHVTASRSALSAGRRALDMAVIAPQMVSEVEPAEAYETAATELVAIGNLLPAEAGDAALGRELLAISKLADARLFANEVTKNTALWPNFTRDTTPLARASDAFASLSTALAEFESVAPEAWSTQFRQAGFATAVSGFGAEIDSVVRAANAGRIETFDTDSFRSFSTETVDFQRSISQSIVERANTQADDTRSATLIRIGLILAAVLVAAIIAWAITRSITRRVKAVADSANQVASDQLPALVEALRDPRGKAVLPEIAPVDARGGDDLAELATAFNSMQSTLIDVAHEQVEVLRRGVSDIFITMARRNRSLIDRQLSMLDEYEASVEDPEVLSNYYQLDHLATRMRRNSESLLVLANAEPKRRRVKATEIDDVVRASIGEVEDYRRIEIQHLESLQVRGNVVADISHLLAELLDNATSFSPPGTPVRVGGRRADESYMLRIVDDGVGISPERLTDLNELLRDPPIVGLSVDATLGLSVVSLLAHKHNIEVTLSAGNPGLTVDVVLPSDLFGPIDQPPQLAPSPATPATESISVPDTPEALVAWNDQPDAAPDESFQQAEPIAPVAEAPAAPPTPAAPQAPAPTPAPAPASPVAADDWTKMSLDTSMFNTTAPAPAESAPAPVEAAPVEPAPVEPALVEPAPVAEFTTPPATPPPHPQPEFNVPPAPPLTADGLAQRPVAPDTAHPAPTPPPAPTLDGTPSLPTRTARGTGPDGPDRLANPPMVDESAVAQSEPQALQAALSAFDNARSAANTEAPGDLPTRAPIANAAPVDDDVPVAQSSIDPSALRDRLRAFQTEFHGADNGAATTDNDNFGDPR